MKFLENLFMGKTSVKGYCAFIGIIYIAALWGLH